MNKDNEKSFENVHWADNSAQRVIEQFPNEIEYTVASGITPSGYIHIGNFREVITSEMVRRALMDKGKKVRFLYSWDSYDAFRKVPNDVPTEWSQYLRMPVGQVPSPFGEGTYGEHFIKLFEDDVKVFNFPIIFQKQHEIQTSGDYADSIKKVLQNKQIVIDALNKYRGEDQQLPSTWMPIDLYDDESKKDNNKILSYDNEYTIEYENESGTKKLVNFKEDPRVKLRWKADWPMRWNFYHVDFEPGGKDHSTPGSSYTVGCEIIKKIFGREAPVYTMYDFVKLKGVGGKISSSKGGALRVKDLLQVYTPEMILFFFAGTRPNAEIDMSFDLDVIKFYEDFDKLERLYFGLEEEKNPKQLATKKRAYELSLVNGVKIPTTLPFQPSFRHLTTIAQVNDFDFNKIKSYYFDQIKTDFDESRLKERLHCVKNWLEKYAPEELKFSFNDKIDLDFVNKLSLNEKNAILETKGILKTIDNPKELFNKFKEIISKHDLEIGDFFKLMYNLIISKDKGPKLGGFMIENKKRVLNLLNQI